MIFNSLEYLLFLPFVFVIYWFCLKRSKKFQNIFLLIMSYFFYGMWNWHFLFLLGFSTLLDFVSGIKIEKSQTKNWKKFWLVLSVLINLGFLGLFKYYNFFIESFEALLIKIGIQYNIELLQIILPVGISFYTFHGLSYVFDIYNNKIHARTNWVDYSLFVSFFPLLVAGPIERATHLLPQIETERHFNYHNVINGLKQILWGLLKKIVIADNCAQYVNLIFDDPENYNSSTLLLGAILFSFQIYGDFSGYSDIALGSARILGFELLRNFSNPYFSRNISEFWKRWHISLSSWFRDYLYIPLGGNKNGLLNQIKNVLIVFIVSGFWHGANWTFLIWGFINGVLVILDNFIFKQPFKNTTVATGRILPNLKEFSQILITFILVSLIWVIFRADSLNDIATYYNQLFSVSIFSIPEIRPTRLTILILIFILIEWIGRENSFAISKLFVGKSKILRWSLYIIIGCSILFFGGKPQSFIYFQF